MAGLPDLEIRVAALETQLATLMIELTKVVPAACPKSNWNS